MREAAAKKEIEEAEEEEEKLRAKERNNYLKSSEAATMFQKAFRKWRGRRDLRKRLAAVCCCCCCCFQMFSNGLQMVYLKCWFKHQWNVFAKYLLERK
jgi:hypothetical protein